MDRDSIPTILAPTDSYNLLIYLLFLVSFRMTFWHFRRMTKNEKPFIQALQGAVTERAPIWLMRQAGRYLPEYRALRAEAGSFLNLCYTPEMATEVTLQPLRRFPLDAAILFSDILVLPQALGQSLTFAEGEGPRLGALDIAALDTVHFEDKLQNIYETVRRVKKELPPEKALIGFAGAPWTIACYMIDGRGGTGFEKTKIFAQERPAEFKALMDILIDTTADYLISQIRAGADAVQLFDSWAGLCPDVLFDEHVTGAALRLTQKLRAAFPETPIIAFPRGIAGRIGAYVDTVMPDGIGLDENNSFDVLPRDVCVQGNLSPAVLKTGGAEMQRAAQDILTQTKDRPFIFNLGHGIDKETPPEHVEALVRQVKEFQR